MVNFLRKFNLWVVFLTFLAYCAPFISPAKVSLFLFFGLSFPWLLLANTLFIVIWAVSRMRYWWFSALTLLLGWTHLTAVFGVHFWKNTEGSAKTANTIRVLQYNVKDYDTPFHKDKAAAKNSLNRFFEQQNADIVCIEEGGEFTEGSMRHLAELFPAIATYPYQLRQKGNEIIIFSRFPILNASKLEDQKTGNGCNFADIQIRDKRIRVFALHLTSNKISVMANNLADNGTIRDDDSWLSAGRMLMRVRQTGIKRTREAEYIASVIQQSPLPVIVCGDFNEIPVSYVYKTLSEGLSDAFQQSAFGFSTTYNGNIPALKIDNILMSKTIEARDCQILNVKYSDHYPIVADLDLNF